MDKLFKNEWSDLGSTGHYKLLAFVVNNKGKFPSVAGLVEREGKKQVCRIKGLLKHALIELNEERDHFEKTPYGNLDILYLKNNHPICIFDTNGTASYFDYAIPNIVNVQFFV